MNGLLQYCALAMAAMFLGLVLPFIKASRGFHALTVMGGTMMLLFTGVLLTDSPKAVFLIVVIAGMSYWLSNRQMHVEMLLTVNQPVFHPAERIHQSTHRPPLKLVERR